MPPPPNQWLYIFSEPKFCHLTKSGQEISIHGLILVLKEFGVLECFGFLIFRMVILNVSCSLLLLHFWQHWMTWGGESNFPSLGVRLIHISHLVPDALSFKVFWLCRVLFRLCSINIRKIETNMQESDINRNCGLYILNSCYIVHSLQHWLDGIFWASILIAGIMFSSSLNSVVEGLMMFYKNHICLVWSWFLSSTCLFVSSGFILGIFLLGLFSRTQSHTSQRRKGLL